MAADVHLPLVDAPLGAVTLAPFDLVIAPTVATPAVVAHPVPTQLALAAPALLRTAPAKDLTTQSNNRPAWLRNYQVALIALDGVLLTATVLGSLAVCFPERDDDLRGIPYAAVAVAIGLLWWAGLALTRTYEARFLGDGREEPKRVVKASLRIAALLGVFCYMGHLPLSRSFVGVFLALGTSLLLAGRLAGRTVVSHQRRRGEWGHRLVVVGTADRVAALTAQLGRAHHAGYSVVGACVLDGGSLPGMSILGELNEIRAVVARSGADTVAVTAGPSMTSAALRALAYDLEGAGVSLIVAPSLLNIAQSRMRIQHVAGLPLLQLEEVRFSGSTGVLKMLLDRSSALVGLIVLLPLLLVLAGAIRLTSAGPVLLTERRLGRVGETFTHVRFRCPTRPGAPGVSGAAQPELTRLGWLLEQFLLHDAPTLINVIRGQMSMVGPPPEPLSALALSTSRQRRLLVKPGVTGLARVTGRRQLTAVEELRLDQQYVDNWSLAQDGVLLLKTARLLLRGQNP